VSTGGAFDLTELSALRSWRSIGPPRGGRATSVAGHPGKSGMFFFGSCGGGVYKTTDAGLTWNNVSDGYLGSSSIGSLAVAPTDPDIVYVGTGEGCPRNDVIAGDGVYRSDDGGRTFHHCGLAATRHIPRLRVSSKDPDTVFVAALGDVFGPSRHRGIYRSHDGGRHWDRCLYKSTMVGAADLWMAPTQPLLLYATMWEYRRLPWDSVSGGSRGGLFRSVDGGDHWIDLTNRPGLPRAMSEDVLLGRMGVAAAPTRPERVWLLVEAGEELGGLYRSDDGGDHFDRISDNRDLLGRPWYYSHIVPDSQNPDILYSMNYDLWRSTDGGHSWTEIETPHGDNHDIWIDPINPEILIEANDGGACVSLNGGKTFSSVHNQVTGAFYKIAVDDHFPYRVYGTQQDNSAIRVPSRSRWGVILRDQCEALAHAESGDIVLDQRDENIVYAGAVGSAGGGGAPLLRYDARTGQTNMITLAPEWTFAEESAKLAHRFNWTFPLFASQHDPKTLYAGGERLFRTTDGGRSWSTMSGDLTRNDRHKLGVSGGPITKDTSGAEVYCTLSSIAESPLDARLLVVGSDDGRVNRTTDGGATWEELSLPGLPDWSSVTSICLSSHAPGTAYVSATRYRLQDRHPYLFKSVDGGDSWMGIVEGLPEDDVIRVVVEDPLVEGVCYIGTEHGVFATLDGGGAWRLLSQGLPVVPVYDLKVKEGDLIVGTHGRGFFVLDDGAAMVRELALDSSRGEGTHSGLGLLVPMLSFRYRTAKVAAPKESGIEYRQSAIVVPRRGHSGAEVRVLDGGCSRTDDLLIGYKLPASSNLDLVEIVVRDQQGVEIVTFRSPPKRNLQLESEKGSRTLAAPHRMAGQSGPLMPLTSLENSPGVHVLSWDWRLQGARLENSALAALVEEEGGGSGPRVPPGRYRVELRACNNVVYRDCEAIADKTLGLSNSEYACQFAMLSRIRDAAVEVNSALRRCRRWQGALRAVMRRADVPLELHRVAVDCNARLQSVEEMLTQPRWRSKYDCREFPAGLDGRLITVAQGIDADDGAPTTQATAVAEKLLDRVSEVVAVLRQLGEGPIAQLNALAAELQIPLVPSGPDLIGD